MWRILQVIIFKEENITSYNPCKNVKNITSLQPLLIEGLQVVIATKMQKNITSCGPY